MKPTTAYLLGGLIALVSVAIGIYYLIPAGLGQHHFLADKLNAVDIKHSLVFFAVAVIALVGARFAANTKSSR
jgi:hypothetical protein